MATPAGGAASSSNASGRVLVFVRTETGLGDSMSGLSGAYWLSQWWGVPLHICWPGAFVGRWKIPLTSDDRCRAWVQQSHDLFHYAPNGVAHPCVHRCKGEGGLRADELYVTRSSKGGSHPWAMYEWWRDQVILNVSASMLGLLARARVVAYSSPYGFVTNAWADVTHPWSAELRARFDSPWAAARFALREVLTLPERGDSPSACVHQRVMMMPLPIDEYVSCPCRELWGVEHAAHPHNASRCSHDNCAVHCVGSHGGHKYNGSSLATHASKVRIFSDDFSSRRGVDYETNQTRRAAFYRQYIADKMEGKVNADEATWLNMATCGSFWLPTSLFSLTAAVAAGADMHLEGRNANEHRSVRVQQGTCAAFTPQATRTLQPPYAVYLGFP